MGARWPENNRAPTNIYKQRGPDWGVQVFVEFGTCTGLHGTRRTGGKREEVGKNVPSFYCGVSIVTDGTSRISAAEPRSTTRASTAKYQLDNATGIAVLTAPTPALKNFKVR
jgi:hypothetical protein